MLVARDAKKIMKAIRGKLVTLHRGTAIWLIADYYKKYGRPEVIERYSQGDKLNFTT
jgi:hypothetical protein